MQMMLPIILALAAMLPNLSMQQCFSLDDTKVQSSPTTRQELFAGEQDFSLAMLREAVAANPTGNIFFSPYSIYNALLLSYFGAANHTEKSLREALRIPESQVRSYQLQ
jgi:serpin B